MFHIQIGSGTVLFITVAGLLQITWKPILCSGPLLSNHQVINTYSVNMLRLLHLQNRQCLIVPTITLQAFLWQQIVWYEHSAKCSRVQVKHTTKCLHQSKTNPSEYNTHCRTFAFEYGEQLGCWGMLNVGSSNWMLIQLSQICIQCEFDSR